MPAAQRSESSGAVLALQHADPLVRSLADAVMRLTERVGVLEASVMDPAPAMRVAKIEARVERLEAPGDGK